MLLDLHAGLDDCDKAMNTLLVLPWDHERGGVVSVCENLARYLQARGHKILFFNPGPSIVLKAGTNKLGFPAVQLRLCFPFALPRRVVSAVAFPFLFPLVLGQLLWFLRRHRIQIVNLHYLIDNYFYFAICKLFLPIRVVTSIHGSDAFNKGKPRDTYSFAFRYILQFSDLVVLPSNAYRTKLLAAFPSVYGKTIFIHNGINPAQFRPTETRTINGAKDQYILCVAEYKDIKAIDVLLRAAKPILTAEGSLSLKLAGDGGLRQELECLASSLGIRSQTQFLGRRSAAEIVDLLHGCTVLVLPSKEESFGIALIEAMACRKPVVATRVGGIPEIIEHGISGLLVDPENPAAMAEGIRCVLENPGLQRTLAENAYNRAMEKFLFQHTGAAYENAFCSLAS